MDMRFDSDIPKAFFFDMRKTGSWLCTVAPLCLALFVSSASAQTQAYFPYIPLFQYNIFYNVNLEMDPSAAMNFNGPVFCNQGIWAGTANLTFSSTVAAAGTVYYAPTGTDPFCTGKVDNAGANSGTPSGNFAYPPASNQPQLNLPVGTNNNPSAAEGLINLPPLNLGAPNPAAYSSNGQVYLFNNCNLIISNSPNGLVGTKGTNITIWFNDPGNSASYLTKIPFDVTNVVAGVSTNRYFSFVTNVSYWDYREAKTVQAVQINVTNLSIWLANAGGGYWINKTSFADNGHGIDSIYVYNNVPPTSSQLPAVRLIHGAQLSYTSSIFGQITQGLTIVTPQPLYVLGNYNVQTVGSAANASAATTNTTYTYPAALMGDAITVLSGNWNDNDTLSTALFLRIPQATTLNAACLEGIVQSTNSNYSGGVENFLRLEENWSASIALTYNGSIVVMFPSIYATSFWTGTGIVYNAPRRNWGFDQNFNNPSLLPALTPLGFYTAITAQPQSQTILQGSNVTFSVTVNSPASWNYQWKFNGINIAGATNISLTLTDVQTNQAGYYAVWVTNSFYWAMSSSAWLIVAAPPTITSQPTNQTVLEGSAVTFSVIASGTPPLSYQWADNETNMFGLTTNSFTLTVVSNAPFAGSMVLGAFQVVITNLYGSVKSSNAVLSVYATTASALDTPVLSGGSQIQFDVTGVSGFNYAVQASTNLMDWVPLLTNTSPFTFTDTNAPDFPQRFYRSVYLP